jgi:Nif-specific regulatory protein
MNDRQPFANTFMGTGQCLDTLNRVLAALAPGHSFRDSLQELLTALAEDMHFDRPHIVVQDPESGELRLSLSYGQADAPEAAYAPGSGITGQVFAEGKPIVVPCMQGREDFQNRLFGRSEEEMARLAFISVPVRVDNADRIEVIGTLSADTPTAPQEELDLRCRFLETVATLVGRQVARLQEELARQHFCMLPDEPLVSGTPFLGHRQFQESAACAAPPDPGRASRPRCCCGRIGRGQGAYGPGPARGQPPPGPALVMLNCAALPQSSLRGSCSAGAKGPLPARCRTARASSARRTRARFFWTRSATFP